MTGPTHETTPGEYLGLLVSKSPERVEAWALALEEAGIPASVEITDRNVAQPGNSPLVGVLGAMPLDFVHVLVVHRDDRERALAALVEAGWDGREGRTWRRQSVDSRGILLGSAAAVAGLALFVLLRLAFS